MFAHLPYAGQASLYIKKFYTLIGFSTYHVIFQHKMHNVVDYVLGAPGPGPKVAGIENNIAR